jgi:hypothetical protein
MMAELNLDPVAPLKIEPEKNILQKAGDWIKGRYGKEIDIAKGAAENLSSPEGVKRTFSAQNIKKNLLPAIIDTLKGQAASSYGVVNAATAGAPDALVGVLSRATKSDAYKKLKEFKKENALASDWGATGGTLPLCWSPVGQGIRRPGR